MRSLPNELVLIILEFVNDGSERDSSLSSCSLVCRQWLQMARPLLLKNVTIFGVHNLVHLHRSLMTSTPLRRHMQTLEIVIDSEEVPSLPLSIRPDRMIADCLKQASGLVKLDLAEVAPSLLTNLVFHRLNCLPKLRSLVVYDIDRSGEKATFDPELLVALPGTVKRLSLWCSSNYFLDLLPEIFSNIYRSRVSTLSENATQPGSSLATNNQGHASHMNGLRVLSLTIDISDPYCTNRFFTVVGRLLSPTLTSCTLCFLVWPRLKNSFLISFLAGCPLLEHLRLLNVEVSPALFNGLQPLCQLRSFSIAFKFCSQTDFDETCQSFAMFISDSRHLDTFTFHLISENDISLSGLTDALIASTTQHELATTLRSITLGWRGNLPVDALERLCKSAPRLEYLEIPFPGGDLLRTSSAIASLKHLDSIVFHGTSCDFRAYSDARKLGGEAPDIISTIFRKKALDAGLLE